MISKSSYFVKETANTLPSVSRFVRKQVVSLFRAWRDEDDSCRAHNAGVSLVATRLARFVMAIWDRES